MCTCRRGIFIELITLLIIPLKTKFRHAQSLSYAIHIRFLIPSINHCFADSIRICITILPFQLNLRYLLYCRPEISSVMRFTAIINKSH